MQTSKTYIKIEAVVKSFMTEFEKQSIEQEPEHEYENMRKINSRQHDAHSCIFISKIAKTLAQLGLYKGLVSRYFLL